MGHDVCHIGKHNLNTNSLEELASDLSNRFQVSVEYGYQDMDSFDFVKGEFINTFDFFTLGKVEFPDSDVKLFLQDEFLQKKLIYQQYGEDLFSLPNFNQMHVDVSEFREAISNQCFELHDFNNDKSWGSIFNDSFKCNYYHWGPRWWSFCRVFTIEHHYYSNFDSINEYRTQLLNFFNKVGCQGVIHCDDQGSDQDLSFNIYSWNDLLSEIENRFGDKVLNVSQFMNEKKLREINGFPPIFYDDFTDLLV